MSGSQTPSSGPPEITAQAQLKAMLAVFLKATDAHALALKSGDPHRIEVALMVMDGARDGARILLAREDV